MKPCPFCGETNQENIYPIKFGGFGEYEYIAVRCQNCGAAGPENSTEKDALEDWNYRVEVEA